MRSLRVQVTLLQDVASWDSDTLKLEWGWNWRRYCLVLRNDRNEQVPLAFSLKTGSKS